MRRLARPGASQLRRRGQQVAGAGVREPAAGVVPNAVGAASAASSSCREDPWGSSRLKSLLQGHVRAGYFSCPRSSPPFSYSPFTADQTTLLAVSSGDAAPRRPAASFHLTPP